MMDPVLRLSFNSSLCLHSFFFFLIFLFLHSFLQSTNIHAHHALCQPLKIQWTLLTYLYFSSLSQIISFTDFTLCSLYCSYLSFCFQYTVGINNLNVTLFFLWINSVQLHKDLNSHCMADSLQKECKIGKVREGTVLLPNHLYSIWGLEYLTIPQITSTR